MLSPDACRRRASDRGRDDVSTRAGVCFRERRLRPFSGETDMFILPGYEFRSVDAMLTNFHLPQSSLLMLVAAFAGKDRILAAYNHAVREKYRFFSYGDAMFLTPARQS